MASWPSESPKSTRQLRAVVRRFVEARGHDRAGPERRSRRRPSSGPRWWDQRPATTGWIGLHVPEEHGGGGYGLPELAVVLEQLGQACAPGPFLPTACAPAVIGASTGEAVEEDTAPGPRAPVRPSVRWPSGRVRSTRDPSGSTATAVIGGALADVLVVAGSHSHRRGVVCARRRCDGSDRAAERRPDSKGRRSSALVRRSARRMRSSPASTASESPRWRRSSSRRRPAA